MFGASGMISLYLFGLCLSYDSVSVDHSFVIVLRGRVVFILSTFSKSHDPVVFFPHNCRQGGAVLPRHMSSPVVAIET